MVQGPWRFVFGRRKTGKTFFVRHFTSWDDYFFIARNGTVLDQNFQTMSYAAFLEVFTRTIGEKRLVIDEFHRLPEDFFDRLHYLGIKGELTVLSSTLLLSKQLMGKGSPMLGLFVPVPIGLLHPIDIVTYLRSFAEPREVFETAVYLREPILIQGYDGRTKLRNYLAHYLWSSGLVLGEILREVFDEEGKSLSLVYNGIMEAIASGRTVSTEIASYLFSRRLLPKDNPGLIQSYLRILTEVGILNKFEVLGRKRFVYRHASPLFDLYFYLRMKYGLGELVVPIGFVAEVVNEKLPYHMEDLIAGFLAERFGLKRIITHDPEFDIALTRFNRLNVVGEIKWTRTLTRGELWKLEAKLAPVAAERKLIIVPDKTRIEGELHEPALELLDASDLLGLLN